MTGPQGPAGGFTWGPPAPPPPPGPPQRSRSRAGWLIPVVLVVVVAVVAGGVLLWQSTQSDAGGDQQRAQAPIGSPKDLLIPFPLDRQPVPTWRLTGADVGLPPGEDTGRMFASSGSKAYFVSYSIEGQGVRGWVYGVDTRSGSVLFPAITMEGYQGGGRGECFSNGPGVGVCLTEADATEGTSDQAWVFDLERGVITYNGPTVLRADGDVPFEVHPMGNPQRGQAWLVATVEGKGVYGVGAKAEPTWFVPGSGRLHYLDRTVEEFPPVTVGVQLPTAVAKKPGEQISAEEKVWRVFSVIDGEDLTPEPPAGLTIDKAEAYSGGFAYQFQEYAKSAGVLFYDDDGKMIAREQPEGSNLLAMYSTGMPVMWHQSSPSTWQVFTATGHHVIDIPATDVTTNFRVIGQNIYVKQPGLFGTQSQWQQWNLLTGQPGATCNIMLDSVEYIGSDGKVALTKTGLGRAPIIATDLSTCRSLWEITDASRVLHVGDGLIKETGDGIGGLAPNP